MRAAGLLIGGDLVACHTTAAAIWGFDIRTDDRLHFLGPPDVDNRRRPGLQVHPSVLGTDDAVRLSGILCTPPARTACDVVRLTAPIDGLAVLDRALASRTCGRDELVAASIQQAGLRERWHRLDTGWRDHRVGAEFDGGIAHLTQQQLRADRDRHNWLTENGWTLLHFTDIDVYRRHTRMSRRVSRWGAARGVPGAVRSGAVGRERL